MTALTPSIEDRLDYLERTVGVLIDITAITAADVGAPDGQTDEGTRRVADAIASRVRDLAGDRRAADERIGDSFDRMAAQLDGAIKRLEDDNERLQALADRLNDAAP